MQSNDCTWRCEFRKCQGYAHILRNVVPLMLRRGFTEAELETILVHTPARLLTFV